MKYSSTVENKLSLIYSINVKEKSGETDLILKIGSILTINEHVHGYYFFYPFTLRCKLKRRTMIHVLKKIFLKLQFFFAYLLLDVNCRQDNDICLEQ